MSPLRHIPAVDDYTLRQLFADISGELDRLVVRISTLEARKNALDFHTDASRPNPESVPKYTMIYNTDDGFPNVSNGSDWYDPTGAVT